MTRQPQHGRPTQVTEHIDVEASIAKLRHLGVLDEEEPIDAEVVPFPERNGEETA
jgi:hypothetical protein